MPPPYRSHKQKPDAPPPAAWHPPSPRPLVPFLAPLVSTLASSNVCLSALGGWGFSAAGYARRSLRSLATVFCLARSGGRNPSGADCLLRSFLRFRLPLRSLPVALRLATSSLHFAYRLSRSGVRVCSPSTPYPQPKPTADGCRRPRSRASRAHILRRQPNADRLRGLRFILDTSNIPKMKLYTESLRRGISIA